MSEGFGRDGPGTWLTVAQTRTRTRIRTRPRTQPRSRSRTRSRTRIRPRSRSRSRPRTRRNAEPTGLLRRNQTAPASTARCHGKRTVYDAFVHNDLSAMPEHAPAVSRIRRPASAWFAVLVLPLLAVSQCKRSSPTSDAALRFEQQAALKSAAVSPQEVGSATAGFAAKGGTYEDWLQVQIELRCHHTVRCQSPSLNYASRAACVADAPFWAWWIFDWHRRDDVSAGRIVFQAEAAVACLGQLLRRGCRSVIPFNDGACARVWRGHLPDGVVSANAAGDEGDACTDGERCRPGLYCVAGDCEPDSRWWPLAGPNERCTGKFCIWGYKCTPDWFGSRCRLWKQLGEICGEDEPVCAEWLTCQAAGRDGKRRCGHLRPEGSPCGSSQPEPVISSLDGICIWSDGVITRKPGRWLHWRQLGQICQPGQCRGIDARCDVGADGQRRCVLAPEVGKPCAPPKPDYGPFFKNRRCRPPAVCDTASGLCALQVPDGTP